MTNKPPPVTLAQFKDWYQRRVNKPWTFSDKVMQQALDLGNKRAELEYLHRQRHKKEKRWAF